MSELLDLAPIYERIIFDFTPRVIVNGREAIEFPQSPARSILVYLSSDQGNGVGEPEEHRHYDEVDDLTRGRRDHWGWFVRVAIHRILKRGGSAEHAARGDVPDFSFKRSHFVHADESGTDDSVGAR